jgi:hypothetical protein
MGQRQKTRISKAPALRQGNVVEKTVTLKKPFTWRDFTSMLLIVSGDRITFWRIMSRHFSF